MNKLWKEKLYRVVEKVNKYKYNSFSLIFYANLWKYNLRLYYLSKEYYDSFSCNSNNLSEALASIKRYLRERLKINLRDNARFLISGLKSRNSSNNIVQIIINILSLNIETEAIIDISQDTKILYHLQYLIKRFNNIIKLYIRDYRDSLIVLIHRIKKISFL